MLSKSELQAEVAKINWFHRIDLPHGIRTPGIDDSQKKLQRIQMPKDLSGLSVLDIGAWDGFFSFEAERRGAIEVVAVDSYIWQGEDKRYSKAGFNLAREALDSKVWCLIKEVYDLKPPSTYDLVLFLGVIYHLRHPLRALECVASKTRDMLIVETHVNRIDDPDPVLLFYPESIKPHGGMAWGPSPQCILDMLSAVGFKEIQEVGIWPFPPKPNQGRMVVHAWK